ncbi:putative 1,3-beta-glucanosyltransferase [Pseudovirgaria hyperparasitica]|uniref:1,3-beta-glucanosyltransferase n=1 Tax=Pseudovirgaria hyperparasitica TaxID=470096 RepID=A0A6A6W8R2_9PEZI|nr:putative 1,3-beta-glucanosyltransferase [Pseudovirgaria hyperparasitica]KAF2758286.1 putative 1,3-beta-glucanosyltransferase [Pseudovirgaria hyperparasitica]
MKNFGVAVAVAALVSTAVADVPAIEIKGSKFFYSNNGTQFFMRGVAYQRDVSTNTTAVPGATYSDPLADVDSCRRDIPFLTELRTNTIRVYAVDPDNNHDECMSMLADAGIYVIADLSQPSESINRDDPSWDDNLYSRYTSVISNLAKYNNTLGFFAGNEVSNNASNTDASAFVKAAVRDSKAYIKNQGLRSIGVGYATNDDKEIRENLADYFNCGSDPAEAIDFWGYNIYSWCGDSSYETSGYKDRTEEFANYSVPVFFAEYGCNEVEPRTFTDVPVLFGDDMAQVWSGGIVYMYFQEENDFGLVSIDGSSVSTLTDFSEYSKQIATVDPSGVNSNSYNPTNTVPADCPAVNTAWLAESTPLPPSANPELCSCMTASLTCAVNADTSTEDYADIFDYICASSDSACDGIAHNATTGVYGAYGMCNSTEQLSFVMNKYAAAQNGQSNACDFDGKASSKRASSQSDTCKNLMSQAGTDGTGTVTSQPSGTNGAGAGTGTGDEGSAAGVTLATLNMGFASLSVYLTVAGLSGAAMVLL